jgi:hypothetical protein
LSKQCSRYITEYMPSSMSVVGGRWPVAQDVADALVFVVFET